MDSFYCLVRIILNKKIVLYYFSYYYSSNIGEKSKKTSCFLCFTAKSARNMLKLLSVHSYFDLISINHAFYLGIELYKAELSLFFNQVYIQD